MITASLKNYRISPRKVRVVADMVRGKGVAEAKLIVSAAVKKAKHPIGDLIDSAIANAKNNFGIEADNLFIKEIRVDGGVILKRYMPVSRGSSHPIKKRTSHIKVTLAPKDVSKSKEVKIKAEKTVKSTKKEKVTKVNKTKK